MQMQHRRAVRGITSQLEGFLKVGMDQASAFSKLLRKKKQTLFGPGLCSASHIKPQLIPSKMFGLLSFRKAHPWPLSCLGSASISNSKV